MVFACFHLTYFYLFVSIHFLLLSPPNIVNGIKNVEAQQCHYNQSDDLQCCHSFSVWISAAKVQNPVGLRFTLCQNRFILGKKRFILRQLTQNKTVGFQEISD